MNSLLHILAFGGRNLWRSHTVKVLLLVVFGTGLYSIYFGKSVVDDQEGRIAQVRAYERTQFDTLLHWASLDTTSAENKAHYLQAVSPAGAGFGRHFTYYVAQETPPGAGLCLGQRDLYPVYYGIHVGDRARQMNVGELANPMKLLTGNFDLSYVFVFLFPLLVVALFYNLYAEEQEGGTLPLLRSQSTNLRLILLGKGLLQLLVVWGSATALLLLGFLLQGISLVEHGGLFLSLLTVVLGYGLLWTVLMAGVVWLRRSSALSAMLGLGIWLVFTLITPALLNLILLANEPPPNRAGVTHAVRTLNDRIWESPKSFVFDRFYAAHPELDRGDTTDFNRFYHASFTLLDAEADRLQSQLEERVRRRNGLLEPWFWLAPAALVHEQLSKLCGTDRQRHLDFIEQTHDYHQALKQLYYTRIFSGEQFSPEDLRRLESEL